MRSPNIEAGQLIKVDAGWINGMNSVRHPWLLKEGQYRRGTNVVNRGGVVQTRPGFAMRLILPEGNLQGMAHFRVTKNNSDVDFMVFAVDGNIYASPFPLAQPKDWDAFRLKGLKFSASAKMIYFCDCEKTVQTLEDQTIRIVPTYNVLVIQDGVTAAGYWDGETAEHLNEAAPDLGTPRGTWMAFSGGRLWVARDKLVIASDLLDPLKFKERTEGTGRGDFSFRKPVTGMTSFMGNDRTEVLAVFTEERSEVLQSGLRNRAQWATTGNFQSILFPSTGCVAGRSIVFQAGLMWWYSNGGLVASDAVASSQLTSQVNFKDAEMAFSKQFLFEDQSGVCGLSFENYLLMSMPVGQNLNSETFVLDYATMSESTSDKIPSWSSSWTGIRPVQWVSASIDNRKRAFAASVDYTALSDGSHNHIWEAFVPARQDTFFELDSDFTLTEYTQPIYCEFETRMLGDGQDLKIFRYAEIDLLELSGDVGLQIDYRGRRGSYKQVLCKKIVSPTTIAESGAIISAEEAEELGTLRRQHRRVLTGDSDPTLGCPTCESEYSENIDKAFSFLIRWCGEAGIESLRVFMDAMPETSSGKCDSDEDRVCLVDEAGQNHQFERSADFVPLDDLYQATIVREFTASASYTATSTCGPGSITGPISVTAISTYTSKISQTDAEEKALQAATASAQSQVAYQRSLSPCTWQSTQSFTKTCDSDLNAAARKTLTLMPTRYIVGGDFWLDRATSQGKITSKTSEGYRELDWVVQNGFLNTPVNEPSGNTVRCLFIRTGTSDRIVVGGVFSQYTNQPRNNLAQLLSDGEIDPSVSFGQGVQCASIAGPAQVLAALNCPPIREVSIVQFQSSNSALGQSTPYVDIYDQNGPVRVWASMPASSQIANISVTTTAGIVGKYFVLDDGTGLNPGVRVYMDDGVTPVPTWAGTTILVPIGTEPPTYTISGIASAIATAVNANPAFSATASAAVVTITSIPAGSRQTPTTPHSSNFGINVTQPGFNARTAPSTPAGGRLLSVSTAVGDSASSLNSKFQAAIHADANLDAILAPYPPGPSGNAGVYVSCLATGPRTAASSPTTVGYFAQRHVAGQNDSILVAGRFDRCITSDLATGGVAHMARILSNDSLDSTFNTKDYLGTSWCAKVLAAVIVTNTASEHYGKIVALVSETSGNQISLVRIGTDGYLDSTFAKTTITQTGTFQEFGCIIRDPQNTSTSGYIVSFPGFNGGKNVGRVTQTGAIDATFNVGTGLNSAAMCAVTNPVNNEIYFGGAFSTYNGATANRIVCVSINGTRDTAFNASAFNSGAEIYDLDFSLQGGSPVLAVSGNFSSYGGNTAAKNWMKINGNTAALLPSTQSFAATATAQSTSSQLDADQLALIEATQAANAALPCT